MPLNFYAELKNAGFKSTLPGGDEPIFITTAKVDDHKCLDAYMQSITAWIGLECTTETLLGITKVSYIYGYDVSEKHLKRHRITDVALVYGNDYGQLPGKMDDIIRREHSYIFNDFSEDTFTPNLDEKYCGNDPKIDSNIQIIVQILISWHWKNDKCIRVAVPDLEPIIFFNKLGEPLSERNPGLSLNSYNLLSHRVLKTIEYLNDIDDVYKKTFIKTKK